MAILTLAVRHDHFSYCQMMEETDMCKGERESREMQERAERWLPGAGGGATGRYRRAQSFGYTSE